jgi:hypothetical protein
MQIPSPLLDRLDAEAQSELPQLFVHLHHAYATQYEIESRTFSDEEFDDAYTFSWGCRQRGFGRAAEAVKDLGSVRAHASGFKQSFTIGPFTIRPYRFGATRPGNIHLQRLDPNSLTKELLGVSNTTQLQEAFDLRCALNPPPSEDASCGSDELVLAHYGNPHEGPAGIFIGAPLSELVNCSFWEWVIELDDVDEVMIDRTASDPPSPQGNVTAFDEATEPDLPMRPRHDDEQESEGS